MNKQTNKNSAKSKVIWSVFFVILAVASVYAITSQASFTAEGFWAFVKNSNPRWLSAAVIATLGFIIFEGLAVLSIIRGFGYPRSFGNGFVYSASDIYFSAITPSASGGQPASAYFMCADGIPVGVTTAALLLNLTMYSLSIVAIGLLCLVICPGAFLNFGIPSKILIIIGSVIQLVLAFVFVLLLKKEKILLSICNFGLNIVTRLHLCRHREKYEKKILKTVEDYRACSEMIVGRKYMLFKAFIFNFLQRLSTVSVSVFVYLAVGGELKNAVEVLATQACVVLGSNTVPVPGAVGVYDYIMIDGFAAFCPDPLDLELFSRSLSFYFCIVLCGLTALIRFCLNKRRIGKKQEEEN